MRKGVSADYRESPVPAGQQSAANIFIEARDMKRARHEARGCVVGLGAPNGMNALPDIWSRALRVSRGRHHRPRTKPRYTRAYDANVYH